MAQWDGLGPFTLVRAAVLTGGSVLWACGSGGPKIPEELLECDCGTGGLGGSPSESYPPGPYGAEVGSVVQDFSFQGYADPSTSQELTNISFADFHDPQGDSGINLLLLNTAAAWCQPCQIEHRDLPDRVSRHAEDGLVVLSLLFQDEGGSPATTTTLDVWVNTFDTNFAMALDPSYQMGRYGPGDNPPLNLVVDPRDMKLLARFVGNQEGPMWEFIERELDARKR